MNQENVNHILCSAHLHRNAVLVTEYLRDRFSGEQIAREAFGYKEQRSLTGELRRYEIILNCSDKQFSSYGDTLLEASRAFLAGCGDFNIWA